jgi:hypothetical protein
VQGAARWRAYLSGVYAPFQLNEAGKALPDGLLIQSNAGHPRKDSAWKPESKRRGKSVVIDVGPVLRQAEARFAAGHVLRHSEGPRPMAGWSRPMAIQRPVGMSAAKK